MSGTITLLIILLATLSTAFLSSIFGMLGGLILMGALITIMPVSQAMVLHGLIQLTSNGYRAWLNKTDIKWVDLFDEINNIQHWMVQQKSRKYLLEKLSQYGWRF